MRRPSTVIPILSLSAAVVLVSCGSRLATGTTETDPVAPVATRLVTTIPEPGATEPTAGPTTLPARPDDLPAPPVPLTVHDSACALAAATEPSYDMDTPHTIPPSDEPLTVEAYAALDRVCPGGTTQIALTVTNVSTHPVKYDGDWVQMANGPDYWKIGEIDVALAPGESHLFVIEAHLAMVRPGTYWMGLVGEAGGGRLFVDTPDNTSPA